MTSIDLIIPTRHRLQKLCRCLASISGPAAGVDVKVVVICDGDPEAARVLIDNVRVNRVTLVPEHRGSVYCRNLATRAAEDAVLYATDDIEFLPGAIAEAVIAHRTRFPAGDGVVGFTQVNHAKYSPAGVALVDRLFLSRYPDRRLFFPDYFHFSCQEIERAASLLGRFYLAPAARLIHHHPSLDERERDATHTEARKFRARDRALSRERAAAGLTWGVTG